MHGTDVREETTVTDCYLLANLVLCWQVEHPTIVAETKSDLPSESTLD